MTPAEQATQQDEDLRGALRTEAGRRLIWRLIDKHRPHGSSYTGEALSSAFADGRKELGRWLLTECQRVSLGDYSRMLSEALQAPVVKVEMGEE